MSDVRVFGKNFQHGLPANLLAKFSALLLQLAGQAGSKVLVLFSLRGVVYWVKPGDCFLD